MRRGFLGLLGGAAAGAAVGLPLLSGLGGYSSTGTLLRSHLPLPTPFTLPLAIPAVLAPAHTDATPTATSWPARRERGDPARGADHDLGV